MASQSNALRFEVRDASGAATTAAFDKKSVTIGASATADIRLAGSDVAHTHALLERRDGEIVVVDLNSPAGTWVNGERVLSKMVLKPGDTLAIGGSTIQVLAPESDALSVDDALIEPAGAPVEAPRASIESLVADTLADAGGVADEPAVAQFVDEPEQAAQVVEADGSTGAEPVPSPAAYTYEEPAPAYEAPPVAEEPAPAYEPAPVSDEPGFPVEPPAPEEPVLTEDVQQALTEALDARQEAHAEMDLYPREPDVGDAQKRVVEVREIYWEHTLNRVEAYAGAKRITVGETSRSDFYCPAELIPAEPFPIGQLSPKGCRLAVTDKMGGSFHDGQAEYDLDDLRRAGRLSGGLDVAPGQSALLKLGPSALFVRYTSKERVPHLPFAKQVNFPYVSLILLLLMGYGFFIYSVITAPEPEVVDSIVADERFVRIMAEQIDEPEPEPEEEQEEIADSGEAAIGEEGKAGRDDSLIDQSTGTVRRALDERVAASSGILGALDQGMENQDRLFGGGALGAGLMENLGNMDGPMNVDARGVGGLGARGAGMGGGGSALGIGGMGTRGRGGRGGGRGGGRYGIGEGGMQRGSGTLANVRAANAEVRGSLDRSIVERIIKQHQSQIRYCYQRELSRSPNLYGRIAIRFIIGADGRVTSSSVNSTTMRNFSVEDCVATTIRRILFPRPRGGGIVVVTFPFVFTPVNQ